MAIAALEGVAAELAPADRSGIESLAGEFRDEQQRGNTALERQLARTRDSRLQERLMALARAARSAEAEAGSAQ